MARVSGGCAFGRRTRSTASCGKPRIERASIDRATCGSLYDEPGKGGWSMSLGNLSGHTDFQSKKNK